MDLGAAIAQKEAGSNSAENKLQQFAEGVKLFVVTVVKQIDSIIAVLGEAEWCDQRQAKDSAVAFEIEELQHAVRKLTQLCKHLVEAVQSLAKSALDDKKHADICKELTANPPSTVTLVDLLSTIQTKFNWCSVCAAKFNEKYEILVKEIKENSLKQSEEQKKQKADYESKTLSGQSSRNWSIGIMTSGGLGAGATVAAGAAAASFAPVAAPLALIVLAGTVAGTTYNAVVSADYYAAARFSKRYLDVLNKAAAAIKSVHEKTSKLKEQEDDLDVYITHTQLIAKTLENSANINKDKLQTQVRNLESHLENLKENMEETLAKCAAINWDPK